MTKGISSIITLVLVVMVTISMAGFFFIYGSRLMSTSTESATESFENMNKNQQVRFDIEYASGNSIYIRNTGANKITNGSVHVYLGGNEVDYNLTGGSDIGSISNITINSSKLLQYGSLQDASLRISGSSFSQDSTVHVRPKTNPVLYYSMDSLNSANPSNVTDNSGSGYKGTKYGYVSYVAGKFGNGTNFTGRAGDYIDSINYPNLNIVGAITISAWVNPRKAITNNTNIVAKRVGSVTTPYLFALTPTGLEFDYSNATPTWFMGAATATIPVGAWTHIMVTRSAANSITYYVNGVNVLTQASPVTAVTNAMNLRIGDDGDATRAVFNGTIDEVMIFNTAIIPDQMFTMS